MKLRRHIAFFAVLVASTVLFAHIFVPHHHSSEDLSVCSPLFGIRHQTGGLAQTAGDQTSDGCDLSHSVPSLSFLLRNPVGDSVQTGFDLFSTPFLLCDNRIEIPEPDSDPSILFTRADRGGDSLWTPDSSSGRAPPVVL